MLMNRNIFIAAALLAASLSAQNPLPVVRLGNITEVQGAQANVLNGLGLITGLDKTGDSSKVTRQALANFIKRNNLNVNVADLSTGGTAMVAVRAVLPAFSKDGMAIDLHVSVIGDSSSLRGGTLLPCELRGWDNNVHATGSGPIAVNAIKAGNANASSAQNHSTAGHISNGGTVVDPVQSYYLSENGHLELRLRNPSIHTAISAAKAINSKMAESGYKAIPVDRYLVRITMPKDMQTEVNAIHVLDSVGNLTVTIQDKARVIIDETSGSIIAGLGVEISPCVVALANLTISVISDDYISQPNTGVKGPGTTERVNRTSIDVQVESSDPKPLTGGGATVAELVANLKSLQLDPLQLIEVFQQLKAGNFLHAELITR